jgi:hypothetical protein
MVVFGKGFQAYAAFGVFLLLVFWLYLLGLVLVIGAELNAFLEEPGRSTALAEATSKAQKGQVALEQTPGNVEAVATGSAAAGGEEPNAAGGGRPLFGGARPQGTVSPQVASEEGQRASGSAQRVGLGGRLIGLVGLLGAAFLLSRQLAAPSQD